MFNNLFKEIKHPKRRQVCVVEIIDEKEIRLLCTAFSELFPNYLFFSDHPSLQSEALSLNKTREYLGLTTSAVILDIRSGVPLDYLLSISATIVAGGILVLLAQAQLEVTESGRFHETIIPTPYFDQYWRGLLTRFTYQWRKGVLTSPLELELGEAEKKEASVTNAGDIDEQVAVMNDFLQEKQGVFTLFSGRGSGKSWLGAKLIATHPHHYILTAPNQNAIEQYQGISGLQFRAPDALFLTISENDQPSQTLIIEEAAKMPLAHLERLCRRFQKVLMISSVENYEGTGQGLREKIQDLIEIKRAYQLYQLKRFLGKDLLKQFCDGLMFQDSDGVMKNAVNQVLEFESKELELQCYDRQNIADLREDLPKLRALYHLLNDTHYQTNIQDLRRLFDAPSQVFVLAFYQQKLIGAIWAMEEGGLSLELTEAVFRGLRRPRGNLVAQMLTGQSYFPEAMLATSVRISRISVVQPLRRRGIGQIMVKFLEEKMKVQREFISVSFGLTADLLQFWESMGYQLAHLGFHLDKSTGLHSAVVLKCLSPHANTHRWIVESFRKFQADAALNIQYRTYRAEILGILEEKALEGCFDFRDQQVIEAFHHFKRAKHTVQNAFFREKLQNID